MSRHHAGSPVLVSARLLTLPADGAELLALDPTDGTLLWRQGRQGQSCLLPYDDEHVLLCQPDLVVINASDGTVAARKNVGCEALRAFVSHGVVLATDGRQTYRWRPELARRVPRFRAHRRVQSGASTQPGLVIETSEGIRLLAGGEAHHGR